MTPVIKPEPDFVRTAALGPNWRLQFTDPDGSPMNMGSFEVIDFGAIGYKEIFQNVKTILATPLYSQPLERTLGVDQGIVDRPITEAAHVTVAILTALTFWEPRVQVMSIDFESDVINGHLIVLLQLQVKNVIYGTNTAYENVRAFDAVAPPVSGQLPPIPEPVVGPPGPQGEAGQRGSQWFTGIGAPVAGQKLQPIKVTGGSPAQGPPGPKGATGQRGSVWFKGTSDPYTPLVNDMYLNTDNGDVWQYDGATWRKINNA